jgi:hypothetical protein
MSIYVFAGFVLAGCASGANPTHERAVQSRPNGVTSSEVPEPAPPPRSIEPAPSPPIASSAPAATGSAEPSAAATAPPPSASAPEPPPPIVLAGVRECTAKEVELEWCVKGRRTGECIEGYCVTTSECPAYCDAVARREHTCDAKLDPECVKYPECVKVEKMVRDACIINRREMKAECIGVVCERLKQMPPAP